MQDSFDVVVVGAGAAGIAAVRRLVRADVSVVALEARPRIGGRVHTIHPQPDLPLDLGAEWLHSADHNPLVRLLEAAGFTIDRTPPAWGRQAGAQGFPAAEQQAFWAAYGDFEERLEAAARTGRDRAAAELFEPGGRWNKLIDAISSYYNGAEYELVSVVDFAAYQDSGVNWRVVEGYGAAITSLADRDRIVTDCAVTTIRHDGPELRCETSRGTIKARAVIVTLPTSLIAQGALSFSPALADKVEAAAGLPLGLADKAFLGLLEPDALPKDAHLLGHPDRTETGSYQLRPFGRPYIEAFLGGRLARALEGEGPRAMTVFAIEELAGLLGSDFRRKVTPLAETAWAADPWSRGSYSHALPGHAGAREILAAPVGNRLFFAGEATSPHAYSTAHGAWQSGERAAEEAVTALSHNPAS
jgi:monoamine oxidase